MYYNYCDMVLKKELLRTIYRVRSSLIPVLYFNSSKSCVILGTKKVDSYTTWYIKYLNLYVVHWFYPEEITFLYKMRLILHKELYIYQHTRVYLRKMLLPLFVYARIMPIKCFCSRQI